MTVSCINNMNNLIRNILKISPHDYFSDSEVSVLLGEGKSADAKSGIIKRLVQKGELIRLKRGVFVLAEEYRRRPINLFELSDILYHPSYVGLHSALSFHGAIPEAVYSVTCLTTNRSRNFNTEIGYFSYTYVNNHIFNKGLLYQNTNTGSFVVSSLEKTILDYIYIHKKEWIDSSSMVRDLRIDLEVVNSLNASLILELASFYHSKRVEKFAVQLSRNLGEANI